MSSRCRSSISLRSDDRERLARALRRATVRTVVGPVSDGWVALFCAEDPDHPGEAHRLASRLSHRLGVVALALDVCNGDLLRYSLFTDGALIDQFSSWTDRAAAKESFGGDAVCLAEACERAEAAPRVSDVLDDPYPSREPTRHADLVEALGLPGYAVGVGLDDIDAGTVPPGLAAADLLGEQPPTGLRVLLRMLGRK